MREAPTGLELKSVAPVWTLRDDGPQQDSEEPWEPGSSSLLKTLRSLGAMVRGTPFKLFRHLSSRRTPVGQLPSVTSQRVDLKNCSSRREGGSFLTDSWCWWASKKPFLTPDVPACGDFMDGSPLIGCPCLPGGPCGGPAAVSTH